MPDPVEVVRRAGATLRAWLDALSDSAPPAAQRLLAIRQMSQIVREVDRALQSASPELIASSNWRDHISEYTRTLRDLQARLLQDEVALRIRSAELARSRARLRAVGAWANLTRHLG